MLLPLQITCQQGGVGVACSASRMHGKASRLYESRVLSTLCNAADIAFVVVDASTASTI